MKPMTVIAVLVALLHWQGKMAMAFENNPVQGAHQDILSEMEETEPQILPEVDILWRATLQRNPTLQLALQKIGEKTGQLKAKEKANFTQKMLQGLIQFGGMGGAALTGSPAPLVGSAMVGRMAAQSKVPSQLTQVTSADLVLLAREIEQAQSQLLTNYMHYRNAQTQVNQLEASLNRLRQEAQEMAAEPSDDVEDTMAALASDQDLKLAQARHALQTYRHLLVLSAGEPAVKDVENRVYNKTNSDKLTQEHEEVK